MTRAQIYKVACALYGASRDEDDPVQFSRLAPTIQTYWEILAKAAIEAFTKAGG